MNSEVHKQEEHNKPEQELEIPEPEIEETGSLTAAAVDQSEEETEESPVLELQSESQLEETTTPLNEPTEHDLSELSPSYNQLPIFDAVEAPPQITSLNDQLKSQGFQVGLNDRLAFVKSLFENSNEDYDRVLSQLSTLDSYEQATSLLNSIIKPDYNNWEGQEDIEARFLEIIEKKFN